MMDTYTFKQVCNIVCQLRPDISASIVDLHVKHFQKLGFLVGTNTGRGKQAHYNDEHLLRICCAMALKGVGILPSDAIKIVNDRWDEICSEKPNITINPIPEIGAVTIQLNVQVVKQIIATQLDDIGTEKKGSDLTPFVKEMERITTDHINSMSPKERREYLRSLRAILKNVESGRARDWLDHDKIEALRKKVIQSASD